MPDKDGPMAVTSVLINGQEASVPANFYELPAEQQNTIVDNIAKARGIGRRPEPAIASPDPEQAGMWPFRRGAAPGDAPKFDPAAGYLGAILRGITGPEDVRSGNIMTPYTRGGQDNNPDAISRASEGASLMTPMSPAYRAGARFGTVSPLGEPTLNPLASPDKAFLGNMRGNLTKPVIVPSATEIKTAATGGIGKGGYQAVEQSGLETPSSHVVAIANDIRDQFGVSFTGAERTRAQLDVMSNPKRSSTPLAELVEHRQELTNIINTSRDGTDRAAAAKARDILDQYLDNLGRGNTQVSGYGPPTMAPEAVGPTLRDARGNTRSAMSASEISGELSPATVGFIEKAEGRTLPVATQLSQRARAILESDKDIRGFSPDERKALETIRDGTTTSASLKWFGDKFGGIDWRSGLSAGSLGGIWGLAGGGQSGAGYLATGLLAAGVISRAVANAMAKGQTRLAEELIRKNSPLAKALTEAAPLSRSPGTGRDKTVMRALLPGLLEEPPPASRLPPGFI